MECIHCAKKILQRKSSKSGVRSHLFYNNPDQSKKVVTQKLVKKKKANFDADELVEAIKEQGEYKKGRDELIHTTDCPLKPRLQSKEYWSARPKAM